MRQTPSVNSASVSRRTVLRGAALGVGASVLGSIAGHTAASAAPRTGKSAIVIGSGFGGAVASLRLGLAGIETTVLERGRRWPIDPAGKTFSTINEPDWRSAWFNDHTYINPLTNYFPPIGRGPGLIDKISGNGIDAIYGAGVGGGSLAFGAFTPQPRRKDFEQVYPKQLDYGELDRVYYPRAKEMLGTSPLPADLLAHPNYKGARAWLADIADFGTEPVLHDFCVNWDLVREELAGTKVPSYSIGEGPYGSNSGAKNSLDHNYLAQAEATGNVTILALHEVIEIREVPGEDKFEITAKRIDESGAIVERKRFVTDYVFMAAGSYYTPALLVTAQAKGTLTRLDGNVGKGYGNNGDFLTTRGLLRRDYGAQQGGPGVAVMYDDDNPDGPISMSWEAAPFPELTLGVLSTNLIQTISHERGSIDFNRSKDKAELNYPFPENVSDVDSRGKRFAARFHDRVEVDKGYPANGIPSYTRLGNFGTASTWHGLGGMVMGQACNFEGQVNGYKNLFVVDGSLLPGSTALVNPALTITAVAERCMDHFVANLS